MKPNLNDIKKHLAGIPDRRLPRGKNAWEEWAFKLAWLQEWQETKELVQSFEKQLQEEIERLEASSKNTKVTYIESVCFSACAQKLKEILGEK